MNIHEYQAKGILEKYGVTIQKGIVADTPEEATAAAKKLNSETGTEWYVLKAQIHAGGRGKGGGEACKHLLEEGQACKQSKAGGPY